MYVVHLAVCKIFVWVETVSDSQVGMSVDAARNSLVGQARGAKRGDFISNAGT